MKHYNFKEIRKNGSCVDFAEQILGAHVENGRCAAVWRGGSRDSVAIDREKWFDHGTGTGGGILELCAAAKFGGTNLAELMQAQEFLGNWLGLKEVILRKAPDSGASRYNELLEEGFKETARYDYINLDGKIVYSVYRMEHPERKKEFLQGTPEHWGISGVTPILYNWPEISKSDWCVIVEGEKDVETLKKYGIPATTNSGGAKKWRPEFADSLAGKKIVILPDNDEPGREHAEIIAQSLLGKAASIRIVPCSRIPKGDVTDYFTKENGTRDGLFAMIAAAQDYTPEVSCGLEAAKAANRNPFRNYAVVESGEGKKKRMEKIPRQINDLIKELHTRLLGAPFKVSEQLFDRDRDTGEINYIYDQAGLFSWIARKTKCTVDWARFDGCVTKAEFYEALRSEAVEYSAISFAPDYPVRKDVFYTHPELPPPSENHEAFRKFVDFFNPDGEVNKSMLAAFIMAPMFYMPLVNRPLWIIDASTGQGSGKSKIPEMVALLYGKDAYYGKPINTSIHELTFQYTELIKRIISTAGRNSRILLIDNAVGTLNSPKFAALITSGCITGRASYGRDEESRPNNLTYVVTVNGATVDSDIASRAYYIMVKKPKMEANWETEVADYITKNRLRIFADIIDILEKHVPYEGIEPVTRMPKFETAVLQAACGSPEQFQRAIEYLEGRKEETNTDEDLAKRLEEEIEIAVASVRPIIGMTNLNAKTDKIFIRADALEEWFSTKSFLHKQNITAVIREMSRTDKLPMVSPIITKYPHHATEKVRRRTGIMWNYQLPGEVRICGLKGREIVEIAEDL